MRRPYAPLTLAALTAAGLVALLMAAAAPAADPPAWSPPAVWLQAENPRAIDGDTVEAAVRLPFGLVLAAVRIRPNNYDAPELRRGPARQRARGRAAHADLAELLTAGDLWLVIEGPGRRDSFGRLLARLVLVDRDTHTPRDLADWAAAAGHLKRQPTEP